MKSREIFDIDHWNIAEKYFRDNGYRLFQMQFNWNKPEGFHAWFYKGNDDIEVFTYNEKVEQAIVRYNG